MSGMTARCERVVRESQLWYSYVCMLAWVYGAYLIVVINCHRVALIQKYMYGYTYMEVFRFTFCIYNCGVWAKMKLLCRYTNNEMCSSTSYAIYERTYVCHRVYRQKQIFPKFVRTYGMSMHHDNYHSHNYIVPPLINFLLGYVTLIHYGLVSEKCTC